MDRSLTLATLADGDAEELFQNALSRVLENIDDPNTNAKGKRVITLEVVLSPTNDDRRSANIDVRVKTKLAPAKPLGSVVSIGIRDGKLAAANPLRQEDLFPKSEARPRLEAVGGEGVTP